MTLLHWSGPAITFVGVLLGAYATLLMCREYHPFGTLAVIRHLFWIGRKLAVGKTEDVRAALQAATDFAKINPANRYRTLAGVYVLVFSFFVQTVGAIFILLDLRNVK